MVTFERLPKPYDTDCTDYGSSNRFECINNCIKSKHLDRFGCIPKEDNHLTLLFDKNIEITKFCNHNYTNMMSSDNFVYQSICKEKCGTPCYENSYEVEISETILDDLTEKIYSVFIALNNDYYINIKYSPQMEFIGLIIKLTNILNLWYGVTIISVILELLEFVKKLFSKVCFTFDIMKYIRKWKLQKYLKVI